MEHFLVVLIKAVRVGSESKDPKPRNGVTEQRVRQRKRKEAEV